MPGRWTCERALGLLGAELRQALLQGCAQARAVRSGGSARKRRALERRGLHDAHERLASKAPAPNIAELAEGLATRRMGSRTRRAA